MMGVSGEIEGSGGVGRNWWCGVGCSLHLSDLPCIGTSSKKGFGHEGGLALTFHGNLPCSHVITSPCIAAPGPSHLRNFHLPLNSESGTGCVI